MGALPPLVPFPQASWQQRLSSQEWDALVQAWVAVSHAYLGLTDAEFKRAIANDESVAVFVSTFVAEKAAAGSGPGLTSTPLLKAVFQLASQLLRLTSEPAVLEYSFLSNIARIYPKRASAPLIAQVFASHSAAVESSLGAVKKLLIPHLEAGIKGDLKLVESRLSALNPLLHVSSEACTFFLAGSDFFDGLVACFTVMNPPLRKVIITTVYLCIVGLTKAEPPKWAMLSDELFTLKTSADTHKQGPLNVNDSLVAELVTSTPILRVILRRAEETSAATDGLKKRISALEAFKKGAMIRPKRLIKRRADKGKGKGKETDDDVQADMHIHQMSQITQVQDLFPDLGAGFVSKCLEEYGDDVEQVVANLLSESLPPHLATADRSEPLSHGQDHKDLAPHNTPPQLPNRRNVFDDDDFDRLVIDDSKISYGKKPEKTADDVLQDRSTAPNKAAIMSALAAFDSDDDERDDTYDAADVGGTVDSTNQEADAASDAHEETLFRAYQADARLFARDVTTRRGNLRSKLRDETGMTDEAIEGWAIMLVRTPAQIRRLELKYSFSGQQAQVDRTSWRASPAGSGNEESDPDGGSGRGRGGRGRGRGGPGRGRGGSVAGPSGEKETEAARRRKEANKSSRANHNRRDGRARKMARGGFAG